MLLIAFWWPATRRLYQCCAQCGERNLVRDSDFFYAICDAEPPDLIRQL
jgi:hypothetical protein